MVLEIQHDGNGFRVRFLCPIHTFTFTWPSTFSVRERENW